MAMSALKVSPDKLKKKSAEFSKDASQVQNITNQMFSIIDQLNGAVWSGMAADTYTKRFKKLEDDTKKMYRMIREFSEDLTEIAGEYIAAENANDATGKALKTNVIA